MTNVAPRQLTYIVQAVSKQTPLLSIHVQLGALQASDRTMSGLRGTSMATNIG